MKNYYNILEIEIGVSELEIKKSFRRLAIKYHPDKNMGDKNFAEKFIEIKEAFDILINPKLKKNYDLKLEDYLDKTTKEEKKKQKKKKQNQKQYEKEREEKFYYEPFKSFYSYRDRVQQETPQFNPIFDIWGENIQANIDFFILPKRIGKIIGAYSDYMKGEQPFSTSQKNIRILKGLAIGLMIGALILLIGKLSLIWTIICFVALCSIALVIVKSTNKFKRTNLFVGVNGFAEYICKDNIDNLTADIEVNFNDITDVYLYQVEKIAN